MDGALRPARFCCSSRKEASRLNQFICILGSPLELSGFFSSRALLQGANVAKGILYAISPHRADYVWIDSGQSVITCLLSGKSSQEEGSWRNADRFGTSSLWGWGRTGKEDGCNRFYPNSCLFYRSCDNVSELKAIPSATLRMGVFSLLPGVG